MEGSNSFVTDNENDKNEEEENDLKIEHFQFPYKWEAPENETQNQNKLKQKRLSSSTTHTPVLKEKIIKSYSATNSPSTRSRLNTSSNNPFLPEDGEGSNGSEEDMNLYHADIFQNYEGSNNSMKNSQQKNKSNADNKYMDTTAKLNSSDKDALHKTKDRSKYELKSIFVNEESCGKEDEDADKTSLNSKKDRSASQKDFSDNPEIHVVILNPPARNKLKDQNRQPKLDPRVTSSSPRYSSGSPKSSNEPIDELVRDNKVISCHSATRVFGKNYKYMKGFIANVQTAEYSCQQAKCQDTNALQQTLSSSKQKTSKEYHLKSSGDYSDIHNEFTADENFLKKYVKLQQEVKSASRKITKLKEINELSVQRKDKLRKEALEGYKTISHLEISADEYRTKQKELIVEITTAKKRLGEAEREASRAIGRASKFERDLNNAETIRSRNYDELKGAERRLNIMESEMREIKSKLRIETEHTYTIVHQLKSKENEISISKSRLEQLEADSIKKEHEHEITLTKFEVARKERAKYASQVDELNNANAILKNDIKRLQTKYDIGQKTIEHCTERVKNQKDKIDSMISSRSVIEKELRKMHNDLSKERAEKHQYSNECRSLTKKFNDCQTSLNNYKMDCETLRSENGILKEKVVYFDLYNQMLDKQTNVSVKNDHISNNHNNNNNNNNSNSNVVRNEKHNSELLEITKKLDGFKQEHDFIHKRVENGKIDCQNKKDSSSVFCKTDNLISTNRLRNDTSHKLFDFDSKTHVTVEDDIASPDKKDDSFFEFDEDSSDQTPIELLMDLKANTVILPSFAVGIQQDLSNGDKQEEHFSEILKAGNSDIANALL